MNRSMLSNKVKAGSVLGVMGLIALGVASRTVFHLGPNFELVTAILVLSAIRLRLPANILVPIMVIGISDMLIGNTTIILFTWSGFLVTWMMARWKREGKSENFIINTARATGLAVVGVLFFYLWTNFGVVVTTNMYPHTLAGYGESLVMALPFLKNQLVSAILMTPALFAVYELVSIKLEKTDLNFARK